MKKWFFLGVPALLLLLRFPPLAGFVLVILILTLGLAAFNTLCRSLFVGPSQDCALQLRERPLRCYLMGMLALLVQTWLVMQMHLLALPLLVANMIWLSYSLPALAVLAGEGIGVSGRWAPAAGSLPIGLSLAFPPGWLLLSQLSLAALGSAVLPKVWRR
ncbi:MAG: hypothetical protein U0931_23495 [Vulcanimicrobiota bacterium]